METPNIPAHSVDNPRAKAYFAEWLSDPTLDFLDDTFEADADDLEELADALFAAEVLAAVIGSPAAALPDDVKAAAKKLKAPNKKQLTRARAAVRSVLEASSPLRAHWAETGADAELATVKNLIDRMT